MISIDISDLKEESNSLQEFLEKKLNVGIKVDGKAMAVGSLEDKLSRSRVKDYLERFFYRNSQSNIYKVRIEKDALKIVKKKT